MSYLDVFQKQQAKVPTVLTLVIIMAVILFLTRLFSVPSIPSRASKIGAVQVKVVNLSPTQAAIFWQTEKKEVGWVVYGSNKSNFDQRVIDERDLDSSKSPYQFHFTILKDLSTNSTYYFKIVSDNQLISKTSSGDPYSFTTPGDLSVSGLNPAYGKLQDNVNQPLPNVIVLLSIKGAFSFATLSKATGEWLIPLNYILDSTTSRNMGINPKTEVTIEFYGENSLKSQVLSDIKDISPVPQTTILGKDYDFINQPNVLGSQVSSAAKKIQIIYPKQNMVIPGSRPLIKGLALPDTQVTVIVQSPVTYSFNTKTDSAGIFSVALNVDLLPGEHVVTIITKDENGKEITLKQNFTIAKSGEEVLGTATAEATPTLFPSPTQAPTTIPSISPNLTPTPSIPRSGSNITPYAFTSLSLIILGAGLMLAF